MTARGSRIGSQTFFLAAPPRPEEKDACKALVILAFKEPGLPGPIPFFVSRLRANHSCRFIPAMDSTWQPMFPAPKSSLAGGNLLRRYDPVGSGGENDAPLRKTTRPMPIGAGLRYGGDGKKLPNVSARWPASANVSPYRNWNFSPLGNPNRSDRLARRGKAQTCSARDGWNFCQASRVGKEKI
jgi:hypothetical protein